MIYSKATSLFHSLSWFEHHVDTIIIKQKQTFKNMLNDWTTFPVTFTLFYDKFYDSSTKIVCYSTLPLISRSPLQFDEPYLSILDCLMVFFIVYHIQKFDSVLCTDHMHLVYMNISYKHDVNSHRYGTVSEMRHGNRVSSTSIFNSIPVSH